MSGNLAVATPKTAPEGVSGKRLRPVEVAPTTAQRKSRPRVVYSAIVVGGLFVVLLTQLLVSIGLADGAYQISALQAEKKELARQRQAVAEELNVLGSPQSLSARAGAAGLVSNGSAVYLDLATGSVLGAAIPSAPGGETVAHGALLIPNALVEPPKAPVEAIIPAAEDPSAVSVAGAPVEADDSAGGNTARMLTPAGAPDALAPSQSVPSLPSGLPAPTTH